MEKAVIYSRVSTKDQSYQSQFTDLKKFAKVNEYQIIRLFGENVSGYDIKAERTEFESMKEFVLANNIKFILMWELSRLGRSAAHTLKQIEYFTSHNINIYFKKENIYTISDNPTHKLVITLLSSMAEMERDTFIERSRRGRRATAELGKRTGFGVMPYGYTADDNDYIIIDEKEVQVIKLIYDLFDQGKSLKGIATHLNSLSIPTRKTLSGKTRKVKGGNSIKILWRSNTISKILRSTLYKGERHYSGLTIIIPIIISTDQWERVQLKFNNKAGYFDRPNDIYQYLIKGKCRCGKCGLAYLSRTDKTPSGFSSYYFCSGRKDKGIKCNNGQVKSSVLDKIVYRLMLSHSEIFISLYNEQINDLNPKEKEQQVAFYKGEIKRLNLQKRRVLHLYTEGHYDDNDIKKEIPRINNEILVNTKSMNKIKQELEKVMQYEVNDVEMFKKLVIEKNFDLKRDFISKYLDKVEINRVTSHNIDFIKSQSDSMGVSIGEHKSPPITSKFRQPHGNDKIAFIKLFAFGAEKPIKAIITTVTEICIVDNNLEFSNGHLVLN